jgi:hypothetical protein
MLEPGPIRTLICGSSVMTVMNMPEAAAGVFVNWKAITGFVLLDESATPIKIKAMKTTGKIG